MAVRIMKKNSIYHSITGCAMLYYEFMRVLPLLMAENSERLLKDEVMNNNCMQVNSMTSRSRFIKEFKLRYNSVPTEFWQNFINLNEESQRMGLLYVLLRTYELVRYFHFNVTIRHWNSVERTLKKSDILMEFSELSAKDETVDGWTAKTKDRCADHYLTILRQTGMLDPRTNELKALRSDPVNYEYYFRAGEEWFLEACLLYPHEIEKLKAECNI